MHFTQKKGEIAINGINVELKNHKLIRYPIACDEGDRVC